ncbi:hypothetical protein C0989_006107 [Termitomyces sp. Mn162]|nr:hypothetical protein C0989_006107 [Termitomyces sp. Mn162]
MAPNHPIPTTPCKNPIGPAAKLPHAPPTTCPSSGQNSPDNFALLQCSVKCDMHQVILAVLQLPLFTQAVIGFCRVAAGIPGTWADCTQYLSTMQLCFADQANFPHIAKQKGLFNSLTATLPVIDCSATNNSIDVQSFLTFADAILQIEKNQQEVQCQQEAEVQSYKLDLLAHCFDTLSLFLSQTEPNGKPKPKKLKVLPAFSHLKPGSKAMLLLLGQVNATLEAVQLADDDTLLPHANLQKHCDAIQLAAQQQLYSLNIALQTYRLISTCLDCLVKTLSPSDIDCTRDLLNDLQVSPEVLSPF